MTVPTKTVWVKWHGPSGTWYVLCDWLYGGAGVDSFDASKDVAIARAQKVAEEHGAELKVYDSSTLNA